MKHPPHRWQAIDNLMVTFTGPGFISDTLWAEFVDDLKNKPVTKMICTTVGDVEVTSVQRKLASEAAKSKKLPIAVVTDSGLVRGMVTAVSWLGVDIKAFPWVEVPQALRHLQIAEVTYARAMTTIERFRRGDT
jgi:hypothetical protein